MNFTIEKEVFLKGLGRVQGIVEKRNTIPVLSNVLLEGSDGELHLTATDLEVGMQSTYPANIRKPGKITVSAKKLYEIIKELPDNEISFHCQGQLLDRSGMRQSPVQYRRLISRGVSQFSANRTKVILSPCPALCARK